MIKRILTFVFVLLTVSAFCADAFAYSSPEIYVDGVKLEDGGMSYIENGVTYAPLRALSKALGAEKVKWKNRTAYVSAPGLELTASPGQSYFTANGRCLFVSGGIRLQNERLIVPLRQLCRAFGAETKWNKTEKAVYITTGGEPIQDAESYYDSDELYWLSRIIHAEASGESLEGKIAVGNVVLNRVQSPVFPNSVYDVIFDRRYGIQFTPAYSGGLKRSPSEESEIAAKLALEGTDVVGDSLYFASASIAASSWAGRNRDYVSRIGNHCFYV